MSLLAEGHFTDLKSSSAIISKALSIFSADLPSVVAELAEQFAEQAGRPITAALIGHANTLVHDIAKRGVKALWRDIQAYVKR